MHLCFEMYFLREQFKEYFCFEMHFLREQFWKTIFFERATHVLKCMNNLFKTYGCWLVWPLLHVFMAAKYCDCWSIFFIKVFTTSKTFAILTCINTNLRCIKDCGLLWIKQTDGPGLCFEDQYEALQVSRNNYRLPGKPWLKQVVPSWGVVVCTSAKVANCVAQMGALNKTGPLRDGYIVRAQSAND